MNPNSKEEYTVEITGLASNGHRASIDVDVYSVLRAFDITDPALAHALKKLLMLTLGRGHKNHDKDFFEALETLQDYKFHMGIKDGNYTKEYMELLKDRKS